MQYLIKYKPLKLSFTNMSTLLRNAFLQNESRTFYLKVLNLTFESMNFVHRRITEEKLYWKNVQIFFYIFNRNNFHRANIKPSKSVISVSSSLFPRKIALMKDTIVSFSSKLEVSYIYEPWKVPGGF